MTNIMKLIECLMEQYNVTEKCAMMMVIDNLLEMIGKSEKNLAQWMGAEGACNE